MADRDLAERRRYRLRAAALPGRPAWVRPGDVLEGMPYTFRDDPMVQLFEPAGDSWIALPSQELEDLGPAGGPDEAGAQ